MQDKHLRKKVCNKQNGEALLQKYTGSLSLLSKGWALSAEPMLRTLGNSEAWLHRKAKVTRFLTLHPQLSGQKTGTHIPS